MLDDLKPFLKLFEGTRNHDNFLLRGLGNADPPKDGSVFHGRQKRIYSQRLFVYMTAEKLDVVDEIKVGRTERISI